MAALMRCARYCLPTVQIPKLLRAISPGASQASTELLFNNASNVHQRSWLSTLAEGMEVADITSSPSSSKVGMLINTAERYLNQFGRISRKQLDPIVTCLDKEGYISVPNSITLLRLYGAVLYDEPPEKRLQMAENLWRKFQKYGLPLDVTHYNALLAVYNQNKFKFSPTEFLANMEANGVTPNRVTYQRLIVRFCEDGDIQGATQVLEHMKSASLPISEQVFNAFITGHLRSNEPDSARNIIDVMRQAGLEPTNITYMSLAVGFAEKGEIDEVKKYIKEAETEDVSLRPGQLLEIYVAFVTSGHTQHLREFLTLLHNGAPFNQDAIRVCNQLIAIGHEEAAYQLFLEMPKPSRTEADEMTLGRFFLRALARHTRPVDTVNEYIHDMQAREFNKDDLSAVAKLAYLEAQPDYALSVLERMKSEGLPVRAHYFWPAFCQFRDTRNRQGLLETLEKLTRLSDTKDDFVHTLHSYVIPAFSVVDESKEDIFAILQKYGFTEKEVNFAHFLYLLETNRPDEAHDFLNGHEVSVSITSFRACFLPLIYGGMSWRKLLQMLARLKSQCDFWRGPALEVTAHLLKHVLVSQKKAGWPDVEEIFKFMEENELKIFRRNQTELSEFFTGVPHEILKKLDGLVLRDKGAAMQERDMEGASMADLTVQELKQIVLQNPGNKSAQKRLLIKACAVGNVEEAEKVRETLEAEGFIFPPQALAQLTYLYANFVKDVGKAQEYLQQLESNFPEYHSFLTPVLKLAALQASLGNTDAAVESLQRYAEKHKASVERQEIKRDDYFRDIVESATDARAAKKLSDTLVSCGYVPEGSGLALDSYMDSVMERLPQQRQTYQRRFQALAMKRAKILCSLKYHFTSEEARNRTLSKPKLGDPDKILQEFEQIIKTHRRSPRVDKVLQFFIHREDPDRLQKVVDLLTELHGLMNVFHHLIADFIECGHVKKARKILETPGLRASMQRMNYYCQSFIERNMIQELEILVEITKDMFGIDRDNMLFQLIRGYVNQKELQKAKDVLLQYEEEMLQPSARTLRFLARSLEKADMPVPFDVPIEDEAQTAAMETTVAALIPAWQKLKDNIESGEVDKVLSVLERSEKTVLQKAIQGMKSPWPENALTSIFESLGRKGDLDTLSTIKEGSLPRFLRNSLKADIFLAAVHSGQFQEMLKRMETEANSAKYLSFSTLNAVQMKDPDMLQNLESITKKLLLEKNYTEPISILWCYYTYNNSPRAEELRKEITNFDKIVLVGLLCHTAVKERKVEVLESLLKMKKEVKEKNGMAVVYSSLLQLYTEQGDVEAVVKTCQHITKDGLSHSELRQGQYIAAQNFLKEKNKTVAAWGDDSESNSSSASDEEKR